MLMLKCPMLSKWFKLADPQLKEHLHDSINFRRFEGFSYTNPTPDETTLVRFWNRLREARLHDRAFHPVVHRIDGQGLLVKEATLMDLVTIEKPRGRTRRDDTRTHYSDAPFATNRRIPHHRYTGQMAVPPYRVFTEYRFGAAKEDDSPHIGDLTLD